MPYIQIPKQQNAITSSVFFFFFNFHLFILHDGMFLRALGRLQFFPLWLWCGKKDGNHFAMPARSACLFGNKNHLQFNLVDSVNCLGSWISNIIIDACAQQSVPVEAAVVEEKTTSGPVVSLSMKCTEQAVNEVFSKTVVSLALSDDGGDRDSLAESLTLSDEKSLCDSFTSLDTLMDQEIDHETPAPDAAKLRPEPANQAGSLQNLEATLEVENAPPVFRRQRWETRSMTNLERSTGPEKLNISVGGWAEAKTSGDGATAAKDLGSTSGPTKGSFVRRRDLWEKRTSITSTPTPPAAPQAAPSQLRPKHTPDLVMDLPPSLPLSSSPKEGDTLVDPASRQRHESESSSSSSNSSSPSSPDMTTAAETFAMQNQSTLKKSTIKQLKKDRADAVAVGTVATAMAETAAPVVVVPATESPRPTSSVKVSVSAYGSASATPISSGIRPITPKIANRFPHHINLYATPMPVLPVAFAAEAAASSGFSSASVDASRPQLKMKPQVLKKPTLPASLSSPETSRRSGFDQDSHVWDYTSPNRIHQLGSNTHYKVSIRDHTRDTRLLPEFLPNHKHKNGHDEILKVDFIFFPFSQFLPTNFLFPTPFAYLRITRASCCPTFPRLSRTFFLTSSPLHAIAVWLIFLNTSPSLSLS